MLDVGVHVSLWTGGGVGTVVSCLWSLCAGDELHFLFA